MEIIKIKSSVKTLSVEWPNGKKSLFSFSCGNTESIKAWIGKASEIEAIARRIESGDSVDEVANLAREVIVMALGEREWSRIKRLSKNDIFAIMQIVTAISSLMSQGIKENVAR